MKLRLTTAAVAASVLLLVQIQTATAQPSNDDLAGATPVTLVPFTDSVADIAAATTEDGEPLDTCAPFANTVWYALTLDTTQIVHVDTAGSNYDTALAVWTGTSFGDLDLVACNDDTFDSLQAAAAFTADAGVTYLVQAGAFFEADPDAVLQISFGDAPKQTGKPTISRHTFRGQSASAFVEEEDGSCFTFRDVVLTEGRAKAHQQQPDRFAELLVSSFSECFDEDTGEFSFTQWFGSTTLTQDQFSLDARLRNASVDATVVVTGESCTEGEPIEEDEGWFFEVHCVDLGSDEVDVSVEWTGQGPTFRSRFSDRSSTRGFRASFTGTSTSREAVVGGAVAGLLLSFSLEDASGLLSKDASMEMVVSRGGSFGF